MRQSSRERVSIRFRSTRGVSFGSQKGSIDILADISDLAFGEHMAPRRHLPPLHAIADRGKKSFPIDGASRLFGNEITRFRENEIRPRPVAVAIQAVACRTIARVQRSSRIEIATRHDRRRGRLRRRVCFCHCMCFSSAAVQETLANIINHGERLLLRQSCAPSCHRRAGASVENRFQHPFPAQQGSRLGARKIARRRNQPLTCPRTAVAAVTVADRAILVVEFGGLLPLCPCPTGAQPGERKSGQTETKEAKSVHWIGVDCVVDRVEDLVR